MSEWHSADLTKIIPPGVEEIVDASSAVIDVLTGLLTAVNAVLDLIASVLSAVENDLIAPLILMVEALRDTVLGIGFYYLPMWDHVLYQVQREIATGHSKATTFDKFLRDMISTMDDRYDVDKPPFQSGACSAFIMVVAVTDISQVIDAFSGVAAIFPTKKDMQKILTGLREVLRYVPPTYSIPYDWENYTSSDLLNEISPDLYLLIRGFFDGIIAALKVGKSAVKALKDLVLLVSKKIDALIQLMNQINALIDSIMALLSATGIYCLYVKSSTGVSGIKQAILNSTSKPFTTGIYVSGAMWLTGPAGTTGMDLLLGSV